METRGAASGTGGFLGEPGVTGVRAKHASTWRERPGATLLTGGGKKAAVASREVPGR